MAGAFSGFIMASLGASVVILSVLLLKKGLNRHISARWQYSIDLLMVAVMALPLFPAGILRHMLSGWFRSGPAADAVSEYLVARTVQTGTGVDSLQDFSVSVTRFMPEKLVIAAALAWLAGVAAFAVAYCAGARRLRLVRESAKTSDNSALNGLFQAAKAELRIKRRVSLGLSVLVKSPIAAGVFSAQIILPHELVERFDEHELRSVLLHELAHIKRYDVQVNKLLCLLKALYWWNPLACLALSTMRGDMEISCDYSALELLPEGSALRYGETVIGFSRKAPRGEPLSFSMEMGAAKRGLTKRIMKIAAYRTGTRRESFKGAAIFITAALLVLVQIPAVTALAKASAGDEHYSFGSPSVRHEDLSLYFKEFEGTFVLYDLKTGAYTIYNEKEATRRVSPASTYKIYSGLIALEEGAVTSSGSSRGWDGTVYSIEAWNRDHDLASAVQNSVSWYFQGLDRQIGKETLESWFEDIGYGNHDLSGGIDGYWMESSLKISAVEQVELLAALLRDEKPFRPENASIMKSILRMSEKEDAVLFGKTGTVTINGKMRSGWFVGYAERNGRTSVFALHIEGDDAGGGAAAKTALSILEDMGIY